jgi:chromosome partitioning protein
MSAVIIAIASQKGGVAKTTTARNVGAELAAQGYRVLLVDCDHQASLTSLCQVRPGDDTLYTLLREYADGGTPDLRPYLYPVATGEYLLPADILLANADLEFIQVDGREQLLAAVLGPLTPEFDYILLDCPPTLGVLTVNALVAAHAVLVPVPAKFLDSRGLDQLTDRVRRIARRLNKGLHLAGVVVTFWEPRLRAQQEMYGQIEAYCQARGITLLGTIRKATSVDEAAAAGQPLRAVPGSSGVAGDYAALTTALVAQEKPHADA